MLGIDLHTHTTASDGSLTPLELIALAKENNTQMLAITDHDTVSGYLSVKEAVTGIRLISGVEISTVWHGIGIHMVGLNFAPEHLSIQQLLSQQATARQQRAEIILHKLNKVGVAIRLDELHEHAQTNHIGRPHIARLMVETGYVSSVDKAFKKYLGTGKVGDVKSGWVSLTEAAQAVRESGGVAVIAHPNHYKMTRSKLLRMIDDFVTVGGQGIEVISGKQHRDISTKFAHIANDKGLYASVGSDFHRYFPYAANVGLLPELPESVTPVWTLFD